MRLSLYMCSCVLRCFWTAFRLGIAQKAGAGGFPAMLALPAVCWLAFALPTHASQQVLKGHVPPITKRLAPVSRLDSGARMNLAIGLPLRNREKLTNLLENLYQPSSPNFRHFLTAD